MAVVLASGSVVQTHQISGSMMIIKIAILLLHHCGRYP